MTDFKMILSVQTPNNYTDFIEIVNKKYSFSLITDFTMLQKLLKTEAFDTVVIFMDSVFIHEIDEELISILQEKEYFLIALNHGSTIDIHNKTFLYDTLDCSKTEYIVRFLIRLEKDVARQLELFSIKNELSKFYHLGKKLTAEKDIQILLELIIDTCIEITNSDAGTIYIVIDEDSLEWSTYERYNNKRKLKFAFAKNKSIEINLSSMAFPIFKSSISGYTVITGKPLCIEDAYHLPNCVEYKFNTQFDENTGYKTKSILSIPMKDHQNKVMGVLQLLNKKGINNHIVPFSAKDTSVIDALAGVAAVVLENNFLYKRTENLLADYKTTIDEEITRRKQADEEINKLLSAVEHSPNTVIITDVKGTILYVNPKFTELTGYEYKEVIGKTPGILNSGYLSGEFYTQFWKNILEGKDWSGEFYNKKKDGTFYWESTRISSLKDEEGSIKYFISVREDITEKKLITQKLAEKNAELQETIKKLHTTQAQLIQSEKMAGIGQLAAGVAHEINNPIGFAKSNLETLKKYVSRFNNLLSSYQKFKTQYSTSSDADKEKMLLEIDHFEKENHIEFLINDLSDLFNDTDNGLKRVQDIVSSLRTFSCIDLLDDFTSYDLNEGIRSTLTVAKNELSNITCIYEELGDIPLIHAFGNEINQVLLNLILNAVYAVQTKSIEEEGIILIKTYQKDHYIYCEINDNGTGMDEKVKNHVFEPFFTTKPVGTGTGLGLSLSYDVIVKKHHGEIFVESELNKGTKFIIKLPIDL